MHFDFEDRYVGYQPVGGAMRRWDGVLLSIGVHAVVILLILFGPSLPFWPRFERVRAEVAEPERGEERARFVFVQPRIDTEAEQPPPIAEDSDRNRIARAERSAPVPSNRLPYAVGNSPERVEAAPEERARGDGPAPEPSPAAKPAPPEEVSPPAPAPEPEERRAEAIVPAPRPPVPPSPPPGGSLGDALRNLQRYIEQESFHNDQGLAQNLGPLQFDTKGVEFGPWIRRFIAQIKRNWLIPEAAMLLKGHVAITFNVHKDGRITDITVAKPSGIDSFDRAAANSLAWSNPTQPLPPEYPSPTAFFTVTFFYNEQPPSQ